METVTRQPFAPLDGARLQNLTSTKNRQNALPASQPAKRKASEILDHDYENVDPALLSKRSRTSLEKFFPSSECCKPPSFILTKAASTSSLSTDVGSVLSSPTKSSALLRSALSPARPRALLQPKSPAAKLNTKLANPSPASAPAGRSPTRAAKRVGLLSSRRRALGPYGRVDPPPSFGISRASEAPFSLDAALRNTIPSYASRVAAADLLGGSHPSDLGFTIHEDTAEQEMTNLLQHSTCVLDISSDEESELKARRERAEGRDKENIPPPDDISQTTSGRAATASTGVLGDDMMAEKARGPLEEMNAADFYAVGCDGRSIIIVPGDEDEETIVGENGDEDVAPLGSSLPEAYEFAPELKLDVDVDALMNRRDGQGAKIAAVLEPIEGTGESFDLWESGSAKDEAEPPVPGSFAPIAAELEPQSAC